MTTEFPIPQDFTIEALSERAKIKLNNKWGFCIVAANKAGAEAMCSVIERSVLNAAVAAREQDGEEVFLVLLKEGDATKWPEGLHATLGEIQGYARMKPMLGKDELLAKVTLLEGDTETIAKQDSLRDVAASTGDSKQEPSPPSK